MKSQLVSVDDHGIHYQSLMFVCPGCQSMRKNQSGLHMLPVNASGDIGKPSWDWDGNLEKPTLSPSILTQGSFVCHSFLRQGVFQFLGDCTHPLVNQFVPIPDLYDWAIREVGDQDG